MSPKHFLRVYRGLPAPCLCAITLRSSQTDVETAGGNNEPSSFILLEGTVSEKLSVLRTHSEGSCWGSSISRLCNQIQSLPFTAHTVNQSKTFYPTVHGLWLEEISIVQFLPSVLPVQPLQSLQAESQRLCLFRFPLALNQSKPLLQR